MNFGDAIPGPPRPSLSNDPFLRNVPKVVKPALDYTAKHPVIDESLRLQPGRSGTYSVEMLPVTKRGMAGRTRNMDLMASINNPNAPVPASGNLCDDPNIKFVSDTVGRAHSTKKPIVCPSGL